MPEKKYKKNINKSWYLDISPINVSTMDISAKDLSWMDISPRRQVDISPTFPLNYVNN